MSKHDRKKLAWWHWPGVKRRPAPKHPTQLLMDAVVREEIYAILGSDLAGRRPANGEPTIPICPAERILPLPEEEAGTASSLPDELERWLSDPRLDPADGTRPGNA